MIKATFETRHFTFEAYGTTEQDAYTTLSKGWRQHCKEYPEADFELLSSQHVEYMDFELGQVFRDGVAI